MPESLIEDPSILQIDDKVTFWAESIQSSILIVSSSEEVLFSNTACIKEFEIRKNDFIFFEKQNGKVKRIRKLKDPLDKDSWIKVSSLLDLDFQGDIAHLVIIEKATSPLKAQRNSPSKTEIESLLGIMPGVVYRCDFDEKRVMRYLSEGCYQLTGYANERLLNHEDFSYSTLIHAEDVLRTWSEIQTAIEENRPYKLAYRIQHAGGEYRTVQEQGKGVFDPSGLVTALEGWIIDISDQKKVEEALQESETHYRNLIEISPDGVVLMDAEGKILFSNQQFALMVGIENNASLNGKQMLDFLSPSIRINAQEEIFTGLSGAISHRGNYEIQRANGTAFPVEINLRAMQGEDGISIAYLCVVRDVSDREETLRALKTSEARYRAIVEDNPEMIVRFKPNGVITFVNQAYCSYRGVPAEQLIGERLSSTPIKECSKSIEELLARISPDMPSDISEVTITKAGGESRWYRWKTQPIRNDEGQFIEYQSVGEDITVEKKSDQINRQSEQHLRTLMESIKLIAIIMDTDGMITFCNSHFLETTGWQRDEAMGKNWFDHFVPQNIANSIKNEILENARAGLVSSRNENMILSRSGEQILVYWNNTLLRDEEGKITAIASIGEDITDKYYNEKTQEIIYNIAQSTITSANLDELYRSIHEILMDFMPAENFYIALSDPETEVISFPYHVDQFDEGPAQRKWGNGLTEYVIRTGKPLLADPDAFNAMMAKGEVELVGTPSVDWIGIPLMIENHAIGMMGVQTYSEGIRFTKRHEQMLLFVSTQVAIAIDRKRAEQALLKSKIRNELLIQASTDSILLQSLSGQILDCNTVSEKMFGYTREEFLTMNVSDLVAPDFLVNKPDLLQWQIENGGVNRDIPCLGKDGKVFLVEASAKITDVEGNKQAVVYFRDVTERKKAENAILESETKFKALTQTTAAGIFINRDHQFQYVNPMWCEITGYTEGELFSTSLWNLFHPDEVERVRQEYDLLYQGGLDSIRLESALITKTGEKKWLDISASFIDYQSEKAVIGTAIDITFRKNREHDLVVMAKISEALRSDLTREQVRYTILTELMELLPIDGAVITTVENKGEVLNLVRSTGCWSSLDGTKIKANEGLSGFIVYSGKPYVNFCAARDPYFLYPEMVENLITLAGIPMATEGITIGAVIVGSNRVMSEDELRLLKTIGDMAASAIHRSDLYEQTFAQAKELKRAYDATLEGWAHALELRDKETQGHSLRIANMTLELAQRMEIDEALLDNIRRGALLHDIGKMGVPDTILLKPGRLTEDEWEIMKKHPTYAFEMLSELPYFKDVLDIPYCHHEWWDGTGYPRGLKGEEIPLAARIFAIVDAWDALVSDRPYRKAWVKQHALKHILDQAGTHFDETIVDHFVRMMLDKGV